MHWRTLIRVCFYVHIKIKYDLRKVVFKEAAWVILKQKCVTREFKKKYQSHSFKITIYTVNILNMKISCNINIADFNAR